MTKRITDALIPGEYTADSFDDTMRRFIEKP
jgi:hypothetical protein